MVAINNLREDKSSIDGIVSAGIPLYETVEGEFGGETTYHLNGRIYTLKDLPREIVKTLGFILEDYIRIFRIAERKKR